MIDIFNWINYDEILGEFANIIAINSNLNLGANDIVSCQTSEHFYYFADFNYPFEFEWHH